MNDGNEPPETESVPITRAYDDFDRAAVTDNLGTGWLDQRGAGFGVAQQSGLQRRRRAQQPVDDGEPAGRPVG